DGSDDRAALGRANRELRNIQAAARTGTGDHDRLELDRPLQVARAQVVSVRIAIERQRQELIESLERAARVSPLSNQARQLREQLPVHTPRDDRARDECPHRDLAFDDEKAAYRNPRDVDNLLAGARHGVCERAPAPHTLVLARQLVDELVPSRQQLPMTARRLDDLVRRDRLDEQTVLAIATDLAALGLTPYCARACPGEQQDERQADHRHER